MLQLLRTRVQKTAMQQQQKMQRYLDLQCFSVGISKQRQFHPCDLYTFGEHHKSTEYACQHTKDLPSNNPNVAQKAKETMRPPVMLRGSAKQ